MLDGYHRTFWGHAAHQVFRGVDVPDASLGIDYAESLSSVPVKFEYVPPPRFILKPVETDITDVTPDGTGKTLNPDAFPNDYYIGEYAMGW